MTRSIHLHNGDTISASRGLTFNGQGPATMTFLDAFSDTIYVAGHNATLIIGPFSQNDTVVDQGRGLHLVMDSAAFITVKGFQNDPTGHIDLYHSGLNSAADLAAHTFSDRAGGTIITIPHGLALSLPGDAHLRPGQVTWHS
jgi:hypothetical protein